MTSSQKAEKQCACCNYTVHSPLESLQNIIPSFNFGSSSTSSSSSSSSSSSPSFPFPVDDPLVIGALSALAGVGLTFGGLRGYRRYWRRIKNSNDVTGKMLDSQRWVKGVVTSVGDGDNFRLFHTPGPFWRFPLKLRSVPDTPKELKDQTLHIRITGVDAPEMAHFGNPAQPHGKESLEWLRATLTGKRVACQILRKDQYNRIVGVPYIRRTLLPNKPLPPLMLKEGMAVVYEAGGAEYGPWGLDGLKKFETEARSAKRGLWKLKKFEHPGDFKKRMKAAEEGLAGPDSASRAASAAKRKSGGVWGFVRRMFGSK